MSIIPKTWHESWTAFLTHETIENLEEIERKIGKIYYPKEENVLRFLQVDLNNVKCIVVGMDPYPSDYLLDGKITPVATGRSFEVGNVTSWQQKFKQSSLRNILKTVYYNETGRVQSLESIREEIREGNFKIREPKEWFDSMEKQGVMFLNASLTLRPHDSGSHSDIWQSFMLDLISFIGSNQDIKWLLWGNDAQKLIGGMILDEKRLIRSVHPRLASFVAENCFSEIPAVNWIG